MNDKPHHNDATLDAIASEVIGANTPHDSSQLASQPRDAHTIRVERELRETVAKLAAASPFMAPPEELRGRILQATAPATFKMADYRKATRDTSRFYRWGLVAATVLLVAGSYYTISLQNALKNKDTAIKMLVADSTNKDQALKALLDPSIKKINLIDEKGVFGQLLVLDAERKTFMAVVPREVLPAGATANITVVQNGVKQEIRAVAVGQSPFTNLTGTLNQPVDQNKPLEVHVNQRVFVAGKQ